MSQTNQRERPRRLDTSEGVIQTSSDVLPGTDEDQCDLCIPEMTLDWIMQTRLHASYGTSRDVHGSKVVTDIVYNEPFSIVVTFKEYLIYDDSSEFLADYFTIEESKKKLMKSIDYYESYSKIFPNYCLLDNKEEMFKNIERK